MKMIRDVCELVDAGRTTRPFGRAAAACLLIGLFCLGLEASGVNAERLAQQLEQNAKTSIGKWRSADLKQAIDLYNRAISQWVGLGRTGEAASCYREIGKLHSVLGEKKLAKDSFSTGLLLATGAGKIGEVSKIKSEIASLNSGSVSYDQNQTLLAEALSLAEASGDRSAKALAHAKTGELLYNMRLPEESAQAYEEAIALADVAGDAESVAAWLTRLSYAYLDQFRYEDALGVLDRSLSVLGGEGDVRFRSMTLKAIGTVLNVSGRKQEALNSYRLSEREMPTEVDFFEQAVLSNGLGSIYEFFGDVDQSIQYRESALYLYEKEGHLQGQMATLISLGRLQSLNGRDSLGLFATAETISGQIGDRHYRAIIHENRGDHFFRRGQIKRSIGEYNEAFDLLDQQVIARQASQVLRKLGRSKAASNEVEDGYNDLLRSLTISKKIQDKLGESDCLYELSKLNLPRLSDTDKLSFASRSVALTEELSSTVPASRLQSTFVSSVFDRYEGYLKRVMNKRSGGDVGRSLDGLEVVERVRSRVMVESLLYSGAEGIADSTSDIVQKETMERSRLSALTDKLSSLLAAEADTSEVNRLQNEIRQVQERIEGFRNEQRSRTPIYAAIKNPEPFDVQDFQANVLDEGSVLLEFSLGAEESYLWAVSKTEVAAYYLPSRSVIEGRVERLRGLLAQTGLREGEAVEEYQRRTAEAEAEYRVEARALSEEILGQAADKFAGKRLIVVADGKLLYFPIGSLPMPGSQTDAPILLTNEVVYEPSASALKILKTERKGAKPVKDLLVFADPVFSKTDERLTGIEADESTIATTLLSVFRSGGMLQTLSRLPASEEEARSIREVVGSGQTTLRSGFAANRDGVINSDIENYKVLHFATHGLIDEKRPELSGIVLSLYDHEGKANDGGVIRLQDVYGLNLRSDLVVLSACDTGIGKEVRGEGLMSLNNAFLQAGAKTVVSSLWKVDDTATKQLMTTFYRGITDGLTASAALRQAQIAMYKDQRYSSPFHWAAFTVQGDYQRVPRFGGSSFWYLALLSLPLAVFGFYAFRRIRRRQS